MINKIIYKDEWNSPLDFETQNKKLFCLQNNNGGRRVEIPAQNNQHKITNTKSNTENCARTPNYYTTHCGITGL